MICCNDLVDSISSSKRAINDQYFSGAQASLFIGDTWVDDIVDINYRVMHNRQPVYGYGSQHFDFVPKGTILVQGEFTINFREPNYLWMILSRYKSFNQKTAVVEGKENAASLLFAARK